uniref:Otopetrin 2 n=1 Tax=Denticeps clupeoides TaxID=299321 RepID=A0AAY4APT0_9TELE
MTSKDEEEARVASPISNAETLAGRTVHSQMAGEAERSWSWLLSALVSLNVLMLGCALLSGTVFSNISLSANNLEVFLLTLVVCTTTWMLYYAAFTAREERAVLYKDAHAGPVWLRAGLVLFALCSVVMDIFKIAKYVGYMHCEPVVTIVYPAVHAVFIFVQTYFLWLHAKDCVQLKKNITRCGLMLTLSTDLMLWITAVTEESLHQTVLPSNTSSAEVVRDSHDFLGQTLDKPKSSCECSHSACSIFEQASYYLYPFNIEYSLFASAMSYVMWKNVGRLVDDHQDHHHQQRLDLRGVILGPVLGLLLLVAGLTTFVMYEVDVAAEGSGKRDEALQIHYIINSVTMSLMSAAAVVGCAIHVWEQRERVSEYNPTRSLDVGLLMGASMGQFAISYFTIVAVVGSGVPGTLNVLNLASNVLTVIQLCLQNVFIIDGLHRQPHVQTHTHAEPQYHDTGFSPVLSTLSEFAPDDLRYQAAGFSPVFSTITDSRQRSPFRRQLGWKRKMMKEICAFLLLANIIMWIMPAFGARPQFDNGIGADFFESYMWVAVVNIGLPFGIFYRMHSVASLFELYVTS